MPNRMPIVRETSRAFTLVEVIVVVAVIGILAAMIVPQAQKMSESAKVTKCIGNLKQLGHGIMLFAADHEGALPPSEEGESSGVYPGPMFGKTVLASGPTWSEYIFKTYLDNDYRPLQCPSTPRTWTHSSRGLRPDYGYNQRLCPVNPATTYRQGMRLASLPKPSQIILLGDSATPNGQNPSTGIYRLLSYADLHPRHRDSSVNVLYLDQHAETLKLDFENPPKDDEPLGRNQFVP